MPEPMAEAPPSTEGGGQNPLTRKLGPLPVWGWGIAVAGSVILFRVVRGKSAFPAPAPAPAPAAAPTIPGSESSVFGNLSASDIAALGQAIIAAGGGVKPPSTAPKPAPKTPSFAGTYTPFGTKYPSYVHTYTQALAWILRALKGGAKPKAPINIGYLPHTTWPYKGN